MGFPVLSQRNVRFIFLSACFYLSSAHRRRCLQKEKFMNGFSLREHPFFTPWRDPVSGVESLILTERVAPWQKAFYFVNSSISPDGDWLWLETAFPPNPVKHLAVVGLDPEQPFIRHFPQAACHAETPVIDSRGRVIFSMIEDTADIWRMDVEGSLEKLFSLPESFVRHRKITRTGTHFTLSADGRYLLWDGKVGNRWYVATLNLETGDFRVIKTFARHYNHAQMSSVDPELFCLAQDHWRDPVSGERGGYDLRIWLMTLDGKRFEPAEPAAFHGPSQAGNEVSHEWWAEDGRLCWIRYLDGAFEMDPGTRNTRHVWKRPLCHAHCDRTGRYWTADESPYRWPEPCKVLFYDRKTGRETEIVSGMPAPEWGRHPWHVDPHPRFVHHDEWIVYTTTVRGTVDAAVCPVGQLAGSTD